MLCVTTRGIAHLFSRLRLSFLCDSATFKSATFSSKVSPTVDVWDGITISELSKLTKRPVGSIIRSVNSGLLGSLRVSSTTSIENRELLTGLVSLLGFRPNFVNRSSPRTTKGRSPMDGFDVHPRPPPDSTCCVPRPPVVAIMGHVDHGKTTLLDALRASRIVDEEFGGITQHLSAFSLSVAEAAAVAGGGIGSEGDGGTITFIDTPGHSAFSAMRARGAKATDIVLLVVAADDGVMPQTVECIRFAKEFGAQLLVAINKIDKHGVDVERTIQGLAAHGVVVERLGGEVQAVEISALQRINLVPLLEAIVVQAEVMQVTADPTGPVEALVLECRTEHGLGKVVNCLVTRGELKQGARSGPLVAGESVGCVRILRNDRGVRVDSVGPGYTAFIAGWKTMPPVGSIILEVASDAEAEAAVWTRRQRRLEQKSRVDRLFIDQRKAEYRAAYEAYLKNCEQMDPVASRRFASRFRKDQTTWLANVGNGKEVKELRVPLIVKADVDGSLGAISDMLATCPSDQCCVQIVSSGVGPVTPAEVDLAAAIGAEIFTFNVDALPGAKSALDAHNLMLHSHNIIYRLAEDVRSLVNDKLPPVYLEEVVGEGVVLQTFEVSVIRTKRQEEVVVGGCRCTQGNILSGKSSKHGTDPILFRVLRPTLDSNDRGDTGIRSSKGTTKPEEADRLEYGEAQEGVPTNSGRVLLDRALCFSLRHGRSDVDSVRRDVEFGIVLLHTNAEHRSLSDLHQHPPEASTTASVFDGWAHGDMIQCFRIVKRPQTLEWHIDCPPTYEI
ncbi:translation initiation factor IF 2 [Echinococcus multilocularis]|uniref:Translation initiation factor IF 2 n=1 Tax=Echinococcus multilocularis TaxID=6211 RepID=A0A087W1D3_ECHMU|nr:translation initiation factor IF 2 [Echinococcus multilocularis]